jgi:hypothetical protein
LYGGASRYWLRDLDGIGALDHARRSSGTQAPERCPISAKPYVNRLTQAWQKRLTILNQTKKSQNLVDADSELNHVSESSLQVTSFASA